MEVFIKFRRLILIIFVFVLCYAVYNPFGEDSVLTLTNVVGSLYLLAAILTFKSKINYSEIKPLIIPLLLLFIWITVISTLNKSEHNVHRSAFNFGLFRNILLFILFFYDLKSDKKFQEKIINTYLISIISVAILFSINVGVTYHSTGRLLIFGTNANEVALWGVLGISFILDKVLFGDKSNSNRLLLLIFIPILLLLISKTGSRGAIVLLSISSLAFAAYAGSNLRAKLNNFIFVSIFGFIVLIFLLQNEILAERFLSFLMEGDSSGRDELWNHAFHIIKNNFFFGTGETGYEIKIIQLYGEFKGPHNVFLYITVVSGLVGLSLFLLFLYRIYQSANKSYKTNNQVLPMVLFMILFLLMLKGGGILVDRVFWFLLAYIASAGITNNEEKFALI